jgi:hypothetical protein
MLDVSTTGDTAHIDTILKFLPHTRVNMDASIFFTAAIFPAFGQGSLQWYFLATFWDNLSAPSSREIYRSHFKGSLEDRTERFSRNVGKETPLYAA